MLKKTFLLAKTVIVYSPVEIEAKTEPGLTKALQKFVDGLNGAPTLSNGLEWSMMPPKGATPWTETERAKLMPQHCVNCDNAVAGPHLNEVGNVGTKPNWQPITGSEEHNAKHVVKTHARKIQGVVKTIAEHKRGNRK